MKKIACISFLAALVICSTAATAADKVVVIPMGSGAKGTDGQVQYNDEGKTAGADVFYDKATGKLQLPGELRTVDGAGNNRLWGKGRPGTGLITHTDPNGYCTTSAGIKHALSSHLEHWGNADDVCPVGTWVCSLADLPVYGGGGACPIVPLSTFSSADCSSTLNPLTPTEHTSLWGWVSDKEESLFPEASNVINGILRNSITWDSAGNMPSCYMYRVWCCWE